MGIFGWLKMQTNGLLESINRAFKRVYYSPTVSGLLMKWQSGNPAVTIPVSMLGGVLFTFGLFTLLGILSKVQMGSHEHISTMSTRDHTSPELPVAEKKVPGCDLHSEYHAARRRLPRQTCAYTDSPTSIPKDTELLHNILVDDERQVMFCYLSSLADDSWKKAMIYSTPSYKNPNSTSSLDTHSSSTLKKFGIKRLKDYTPEEIKSRVDTYFKFMYVGHPMKRLPMVFNEIFHDKGSYLAAQLSGPILKEYRDKDHQDVSKHPIKFKEFVRYIIDQISQGKELWGYWRTYNETCFPCAMQYNFIGRMENLVNDSWCAIPKLATQSPDLDLWKLHYLANHGAKYENDVTWYYDGIPENELNRIKYVYDTDCQMFDFNCNHLKH